MFVYYLDNIILFNPLTSFAPLMWKKMIKDTLGYIFLTAVILCKYNRQSIDLKLCENDLTRCLGDLPYYVVQ